MNVLTLITNPATFPLTQPLINKVSEALKSGGAAVTPVDWLAPQKAADITFSGMGEETATEIVAQTLGNQPVDSIIQRAANRRKKLLISDMDSTIIQQECIDELADFVGLKAHVAAITERAMNGELEFQDALRERVMLLKGLSEAVLHEAYNCKITFTPGAKALVQTMRKHGSYCMLVSGGFTFFTEKVTHEVGFHFHDSNILDIMDGKLTGKVLKPIRDKHSKLASLKKYVQENHITEADVLAVGDGANDLPMLQAAGLGVAFYAKPTVQQQAKARINHTDLTALLYAQGYREGDITDGNG